jgi:hypothetical protein
LYVPGAHLACRQQACLGHADRETAPSNQQQTEEALSLAVRHPILTSRLERDLDSGPGAVAGRGQHLLPGSRPGEADMPGGQLAKPATEPIGRHGNPPWRDRRLRR